MSKWWNSYIPNDFSGEIFGGHVRAVFSLITVIFIICVSATVTSFKEIPLEELKEQVDMSYIVLCRPYDMTKIKKKTFGT